MAGVYWKLHHPHADRKHYRRSISRGGIKLCPGSLRESGRWVTMERNCCSTCRHLVRRLPVSGLERGPACHPESSEGSVRPSRQTLRCSQDYTHDLQMSPPLGCPLLLPSFSP